MKRILIIDDNRDFRIMLKFALMEENYQIMEATNGIEGEQLYREDPCDLIVMDIFMPKKDGLDTIFDLKEVFPQVKIIAISGGGSQGRTKNALKMASAYGADAILNKPLNMDEFFKVVKDNIRMENRSLD